MATIRENVEFWSRYDWSQRGEEWSGEWGGSQGLWWGMLFPRLSRFLPTGSVLEIAPGAGRMTQFLLRLAQRLYVVDLSPACLDICRDRFSAHRHIEYLPTDGKSLGGISDRSINFAFSFDSLVHADMDTLSGYLAELGRVLADDGAAFLHHSNLGSYVNLESGEIDVPNLHWRDPAVSAKSVAQRASELGLLAVVQERINWCGPDLIDTLTLLVRASGPWANAPRAADNPEFMRDAETLRRLMTLWNPDQT